MLELQGHKVSLPTAFNRPDCLESILSRDQGTPGYLLYVYFSSAQGFTVYARWPAHWGLNQFLAPLARQISAIQRALVSDLSNLQQIK